MAEAAGRPRPFMSRAGMMLGIRLSAPFLPGIIVFGSAFGTSAAQKGLTLTETVLSSALVFAGASQLVSLELWRTDWDFASVAAISLLVFTVNARMILMGASLHSWAGTLPGRTLWPSLYLLTDANWIIAERYRREGGLDFGVMVGPGILFWFVWVFVAVPGYLLGSFVDDPKRFGFDFVMPIVFAGMCVPMWKGRQDLFPWLAAGAASALTAALFSGYAFIVVGALTGALTAAILPGPDDA